MEYVIELSTMQGDGVAEEEYSVIRSEVPMPVPNIGEKVYVPGGCSCWGGTEARFFEVSDRLFTYRPNNGREGSVHVQLFCRVTED